MERMPNTPKQTNEQTLNKAEKEKLSPFVYVGSPEYFKLKDPKFKMTPLTYLTISTATPCNLSCTFCALETESICKLTPEEERVKEKIPEIIDRFSKLGTKQVVVFGRGEPTMGAGYEDIIKPLIGEATHKGVGTTLFSTLTYLDDRKIQELYDNDVSLMISLHSLSPENYKKVVTNGNPERVYENIERLVKYYREKGEPKNIEGSSQKLSRLGVNFTLNESNSGELDTTKEWAHEHDMLFVSNVSMKKGRVEEEDKFDSVTGGEKQYEEQKKKAVEASDTKGQSSLVEGFCGFGRNGLAFNTDGTMMICGYEEGLAEIMPNILDLIKLSDDAIKEFADIMSGKELWDILENPCVTRACQNSRELFMERLKAKIIEFDNKHNL